jgi:hypothetical protein
MGFCVGCLDVTACTSNDHPQFDYVRLSVGAELEMRLPPTLMVYDCRSWYFYLPRRVHIAGGRLEEKEGLFWDGITQFTRVLRIVSPNSHYLFTRARE